MGGVGGWVGWEAFYLDVEGQHHAGLDLLEDVELGLGHQVGVEVRGEVLVEDLAFTHGCLGVVVWCGAVEEEEEEGRRASAACCGPWLGGKDEEEACGATAACKWMGWCVSRWWWWWWWWRATVVMVCVGGVAA